MNVSPLDLRQQRFRKAFRGFDPVEVATVELKLPHGVRTVKPPAHLSTGEVISAGQGR